MARKARNLPPPTKADWYVPEADGNRLAPPEDRVRVLLRTPTASDMRRAAARSVDKEDIEGGRPRMGWSVIFQQELVRLCVLRVENYDGPAGAIVDGDDFATYGEDAFLTETGEKLITTGSLRVDFCEVCGADLPDGEKKCVNPTCPTVLEGKAQEITEGEGVPSDDSSGSNGQVTPLAGRSAPEGQSSASEDAPGQGGGTSSGEDSSASESARAAG